MNLMNLFKRPNAMPYQFLEDWSLQFPPANITLYNAKTGRQIQEPSLVAAKIQFVAQASEALLECVSTTSGKMIERYLAAGKAALEYRNTPDVVVFSPLRQGQIAYYDAARFMLESFLPQASPGLHLWKCVTCVNVQSQTTQAEERAIIETAIMAGSRKVYLYKEPLSKILENIPKPLRKAIFIHIDPQE